MRNESENRVAVIFTMLRINNAGNLEIDLADLVSSSGSDRLVRELARVAAFQQAIVLRVVDHLRDEWTDDGDAWDSHMSQLVRLHLLPHVSDAVAVMVRQLDNRREAAETRADRWRDACIKMAIEWEQMDRQRCQTLGRIDYATRRTMTSHQARQMIVDMEQRDQ